METIKILLADDHPFFRSGVASFLNEQEGFEVVGEAQDGEEAVQKANELMPDVILMDVYMPGMSGLEATRRLKQMLPYVKIIMLTFSEEDRDLFESVKAGAYGYLLKKVEPDEVARAIRGVMRGEAPLSRKAAAKILGEFTRLAQGGPGSRPAEKLSPRERQVLEFLTKGATNKEIASSLYVSESTVKNYLQNILEKLHLENRVQAAAFALREGLV